MDVPSASTSRPRRVVKLVVCTVSTGPTFVYCGTMKEVFFVPLIHFEIPSFSLFHDVPFPPSLLVCLLNCHASSAFLMFFFVIHHLVPVLASVASLGRSCNQRALFVS